MMMKDDTRTGQEKKKRKKRDLPPHPLLVQEFEIIDQLMVREVCNQSTLPRK